METPANKQKTPTDPKYKQNGLYQVRTDAGIMVVCLHEIGAIVRSEAGGCQIYLPRLSVTMNAYPDDAAGLQQAWATYRTYHQNYNCTYDGPYPAPDTTTEDSFDV